MKIDSGKKIAPSFYISAITHKFAWVCAEAQQGTWKHQFCALLCTCVGNSAEYDRSYYCLLIGCHVQSVEPVVCVCVCRRASRMQRSRREQRWQRLCQTATKMKRRKARCTVDTVTDCVSIILNLCIQGDLKSAATFDCSHF